MTVTAEAIRSEESTQEEPPALSEGQVRALTPSAKLVLTVIQHEGPLTQQALATETRLPQRTVRDATSRLLDAGVLERRVYIPDARQSRYALAAELP